jgi:hypothetical protein
MKWIKRTAYSIGCGQYIIARVVMWGKDGFCLFCGEEWLGLHDSAAEARQVAKLHSEGK